MKLWCPDGNPDGTIEQFTVGNDHILDQRLVPYDCRASIAHAAMLRAAGVLTEEEFRELERGLEDVLDIHGRGEFEIRPEHEDCHTAIENFLTERCGETGRKIHTARSRNDQVLTALRLYEKHELAEIERLAGEYRCAIEGVIERYGAEPIPGYTHMQRAMPTTVAVWIGSFAAAVEDDLDLLRTVMQTVDQCPLGTAAGFGVPVLEIDRNLAARRLGFSRVLENPMYAQLSRGRMEAAVLGVCSQITLGLNRLATDLILFATSEFGFVRLPSDLTTGSSIMPQKRNPDVLELVRSAYHEVVGEELKIKGIAANLMSGYNRDIQRTKEPLFNGIDTTRSCLEATRIVLDNLSFDVDRCRAAMTDELFAVHRVYQLVMQGVPFRDAYRTVASDYACKETEC